jgi:nucleoside 2-deoxyribosyltransferase
MERIKTCYLAGPISGLSYGTATDWRVYVASKFPEWLKPLSPLRGKTYLQGEKDLSDHYTQLLSTPRGITTRDRMDAMKSDCLLVNFLAAKKVSIGTCIELGWADAVRNPIVVVMEKDNLHCHAMVNDVAGYITSDLDEAIDIVIKIMATG